MLEPAPPIYVGSPEDAAKIAELELRLAEHSRALADARREIASLERGAAKLASSNAVIDGLNDSGRRLADALESARCTIARVRDVVAQIESPSIGGSSQPCLDCAAMVKTALLRAP